MECKYEVDELCTNDQCPMCADYCPVPDVEGICRHEVREEAVYVLTPRGCAEAALNAIGCHMDEDDFDGFWGEFVRLMGQFGYVREEG